MNRPDRHPPPAAEALLEFRNADYRVVRPGTFVKCCITGIAIPLEDLKYWDADRQEAYATPGAKLEQLRIIGKLDHR